MHETKLNSDCLKITKYLEERGFLSGFDLHFGEFIERAAGETGSPCLILAAALTSRTTRNGNICLDLVRAEELVPQDTASEDLPSFPDPDEWIQEIRKSTAVGSQSDFTPLILDGENRLYLHRYWAYQENLAHKLRVRAGRFDGNADLDALSQALNRFSSRSCDENEVDRQRIAACVAFLRRFCVVSGGPGTGKTTTVALVLALLADLLGPAPLRIAIAAPTGKSAARLGQAIRNALTRLPWPQEIKSTIPLSATTIHRLLGTIKGSPYFRHHAGNKLPFDVIVVDEASMVDLALMAKLVDAVPDDARLILLGDHDQLASVEAGAVLGDICRSDKAEGFSEHFRDLLEKATGEKNLPSEESDSPNPLRDCIVILKKSYRFGKTSGIGNLSRNINRGEENEAISSLRKGLLRDIDWSNTPSPADLHSKIKARALEPFLKSIEENDPSRSLRSFESFRILCALREGPYGSRNINRILEKALLERGVIRPSWPWYAGRPVMISTNNYDLQLFNGDIGIVLASREDDWELRVYFPKPDGGIRKIHPIRLPDHETAFAMTVHKGQGSEFDKVLLIFPDRPSPLLTRELLYTAITRAKDEVEIWSPEMVLRTTISKKIYRSSGLSDALWKS
jgi:exodeoxyribonuclease V alpha subunit